KIQQRCGKLVKPERIHGGNAPRKSDAKTKLAQRPRADLVRGPQRHYFLTVWFTARTQSSAAVKRLTTPSRVSEIPTNRDGPRFLTCFLSDDTGICRQTQGGRHE